MYSHDMWRNKIIAGTEVLFLRKEKSCNVNHHYVTSVLMAIVAGWWLAVLEYLTVEEMLIVTLCLLCYLVNFFLYSTKMGEATNRKEEIKAVVKYHCFNVILFAMGCIENWQLMFWASVMAFLVPLFFYGVQMTFLSICYRKEKFPEWFRIFAVICYLILTFVPSGLLLAMMLFSNMVFFILAVPLWLLYVCVGMPLIALNEYEGQNLFEFAFEMTY